MHFEQATLDALRTCTISTEISAEKGKPVRYMPGCESTCLASQAVKGKRAKVKVIFSWMDMFLTLMFLCEGIRPFLPTWEGQFKLVARNPAKALGTCLWVYLRTTVQFSTGWSQPRCEKHRRLKSCGKSFRRMFVLHWVQITWELWRQVT